ncbi:MAG: hypothetical protein ACTSRP_24995 [Candidatus Helarchaeota archaeon]
MISGGNCDLVIIIMNLKKQKLYDKKCLLIHYITGTILEFSIFSLVQE